MRMTIEHYIVGRGACALYLDTWLTEGTNLWWVYAGRHFNVNKRRDPVAALMRDIL
jgi:hypothetical protein